MPNLNPKLTQNPYRWPWNQKLRIACRYIKHEVFKQYAEKMLLYHDAEFEKKCTAAVLDVMQEFQTCPVKSQLKAFIDFHNMAIKEAAQMANRMEDGKFRIKLPKYLSILDYRFHIVQLASKRHVKYRKKNKDKQRLAEELQDTFITTAVTLANDTKGRLQDALGKCATLPGLSPAAAEELWLKIIDVVSGKLKALCNGTDVHLSASEWSLADKLLLQEGHLYGQLDYQKMYTKQVVQLCCIYRYVRKHGVEDPNAAMSEQLNRWRDLYEEYCLREVVPVSLVFLQHRWYRAKCMTKKVFYDLTRARTDYQRADILRPVAFALVQAIAKRYPHVAAKPIPLWQPLVQTNQVVETEVPRIWPGGHLEPLAEISDDDDAPRIEKDINKICLEFDKDEGDSNSEVTVGSENVGTNSIVIDIDGEGDVLKTKENNQLSHRDSKLILKTPTGDVTKDNGNYLLKNITNSNLDDSGNAVLKNLSAKTSSPSDNVDNVNTNKNSDDTTIKNEDISIDNVDIPVTSNLPVDTLLDKSIKQSIENEMMSKISHLVNEKAANNNRSNISEKDKILRKLIENEIDESLNRTDTSETPNVNAETSEGSIINVLETIDPTKATTSIIFEDDDSDDFDLPFQDSQNDPEDVKNIEIDVPTYLPLNETENYDPNTELKLADSKIKEESLNDIKKKQLNDNMNTIDNIDKTTKNTNSQDQTLSSLIIKAIKEFCNSEKVKDISGDFESVINETDIINNVNEIQNKGVSDPKSCDTALSESFSVSDGISKGDGDKLLGELYSIDDKTSEESRFKLLDSKLTMVAVVPLVKVDKFINIMKKEYNLNQLYQTLIDKPDKEKTKNAVLVAIEKKRKEKELSMKELEPLLPTAKPIPLFVKSLPSVITSDRKRKRDDSSIVKLNSNMDATSVRVEGSVSIIKSSVSKIESKPSKIEGTSKIGGTTSKVEVKSSKLGGIASKTDGASTNLGGKSSNLGEAASKIEGTSTKPGETASTIEDTTAKYDSPTMKTYHNKNLSKHWNSMIIKRFGVDLTTYDNNFKRMNFAKIQKCRPIRLRIQKLPFTYTKSTNRKRKKVELPNIEEVRRNNKQMLTAQVAPLTVENVSSGENNNKSLRVITVGHDHGYSLIYTPKIEPLVDERADIDSADSNIDVGSITGSNIGNQSNNPTSDNNIGLNIGDPSTHTTSDSIIGTNVGNPMEVSSKITTSKTIDNKSDSDFSFYDDMDSPSSPDSVKGKRRPSIEEDPTFEPSSKKRKRSTRNSKVRKDTKGINESKDFTKENNIVPVPTPVLKKTTDKSSLGSDFSDFNNAMEAALDVASVTKLVLAAQHWRDNRSLPPRTPCCKASATARTNEFRRARGKQLLTSHIHKDGICNCCCAHLLKGVAEPFRTTEILVKQKLLEAVCAITGVDAITGIDATIIPVPSQTKTKRKKVDNKVDSSDSDGDIDINAWNREKNKSAIMYGFKPKAPVVIADKKTTDNAGNGSLTEEIRTNCPALTHILTNTSNANVPKDFNQPSTSKDAFAVTKVNESPFLQQQIVSHSNKSQNIPHQKQLYINVPNIFDTKPTPLSKIEGWKDIKPKPGPVNCISIGNKTVSNIELENEPSNKSMTQERNEVTSNIHKLRHSMGKQNIDIYTKESTVNLSLTPKRKTKPTVVTLQKIDLNTNENCLPKTIILKLDHDSKMPTISNVKSLLNKNNDLNNIASTSKNSKTNLETNFESNKNAPSITKATSIAEDSNEDSDSDSSNRLCINSNKDSESDDDDNKIIIPSNMSQSETKSDSVTASLPITEPNNALDNLVISNITSLAPNLTNDNDSNLPKLASVDNSRTAGMTATKPTSEQDYARIEMSKDVILVNLKDLQLVKVRQNVSFPKPIDATQQSRIAQTMISEDVVRHAPWNSPPPPPEELLRQAPWNKERNTTVPPRTIKVPPTLPAPPSLEHPRALPVNRHTILGPPLHVRAYMKDKDPTEISVIFWNIAKPLWLLKGMIVLTESQQDQTGCYFSLGHHIQRLIFEETPQECDKILTLDDSPNEYLVPIESVSNKRTRSVLKSNVCKKNSDKIVDMIEETISDENAKLDMPTLDTVSKVTLEKIDVDPLSVNDDMLTVNQTNTSLNYDKKTSKSNENDKDNISTESIGNTSNNITDASINTIEDNNKDVITGNANKNECSTNSNNTNSENQDKISESDGILKDDDSKTIEVTSIITKVVENNKTMSKETDNINTDLKSTSQRVDESNKNSTVITESKSVVEPSDYTHSDLVNKINNTNIECVANNKPENIETVSKINASKDGKDTSTSESNLDDKKNTKTKDSQPLTKIYLKVKSFAKYIDDNIPETNTVQEESNSYLNPFINQNLLNQNIDNPSIPLNIITPMPVTLNDSILRHTLNQNLVSQSLTQSLTQPLNQPLPNLLNHNFNPNIIMPITSVIGCPPFLTQNPVLQVTQPLPQIPNVIPTQPLTQPMTQLSANNIISPLLPMTPVTTNTMSVDKGKSPVTKTGKMPVTKKTSQNDNSDVTKNDYACENPNVAEAPPLKTPDLIRVHGAVYKKLVDHPLTYGQVLYIVHSEKQCSELLVKDHGLKIFNPATLELYEVYKDIKYERTSTTKSKVVGLKCTDSRILDILISRLNRAMTKCSFPNVYREKPKNTDKTENSSRNPTNSVITNTNSATNSSIRVDDMKKLKTSLDKANPFYNYDEAINSVVNNENSGKNKISGADSVIVLDSDDD